ncbi:SAP30-binding protein [Aphelenchoides besseyi]|nr:SAP30-binding protein [Aphelenchoides besseyi]
MDVQFLSMLGLMILVFVTPLLIQCKSKKKPMDQKKISKQSGKSNLVRVSSGKNTKSKTEGSGKTADDQQKPKVAMVVEAKNVKKQAGPFDEDYPEVVEPTPSVKKKREKELEESRKLKIKKGFYQSMDTDDTSTQQPNTPTSLTLLNEPSESVEQFQPPPIARTFAELPPSPPGEIDDELQFEKLFKMKFEHGMDMNRQILQRKDFKNPAIYDKMKEEYGVNEYGTNYVDTGAKDEIHLDESDYYDKLSEEQSRVIEQEEKRTKIGKK